MAAHRSACAARPGIALLEVLVSVSVIGIGMGVALHTLGACARTQSRLEHREVARRLAERQLALLRLEGASSLDREAGGRFGEPFGEYGWSAECRTPSGDSPFTLVNLSVWRTEAAGRATLYWLQAFL